MGLSIVYIEALFGQASLDIVWGPSETTSISLGIVPVYIGGGDDHIHVAGLPEHAFAVVFDQGKIHCTDPARGKRTELKNGSQIKIGNITVVVRAKN